MPLDTPLDTPAQPPAIIRDEASRTFLLTRLADARALLSDRTYWKDADKAEAGALVRTFKPADMNRPGDRDSGIGWMDDPEHARVRPVIAQALNRRVAAARPVIERTVQAALDALAGLDAFDIVADYAQPIPIAVVGHILGVDTADLAQFRAWSEAAIAVFLPESAGPGAAATKAASEAISDHLDALMARRRRAPGEDLISDLLAAQGEGRLSDSEIRVNCMNLLLGGNVTTADLIASAAWLLLSHPDELARVRAEPGLIDGAIEETLRLEPPTGGAQRIASRDVTIHGCPVRAGQVVAAMFRPAHRDPAVFTNPEAFRIARREGPHIAFGGGPHICIGAALARLEARVAVGRLFARFPGLRLADPAAPPAWRPTPIFRGLDHLDVRP